MAQAYCKGADPDGSLFHAPGRSVAQRKAVEMCQACPVRQQCLDWITEIEKDEQDPNCIVGVYGGLTPRQRKERKRNARNH